MAGKSIESPELSAADSYIPREGPIEALARELHWKMEHLDPSDNPGWDELTDHDKNFYRCCVEWLLMEPKVVLAALAHNNLIYRSAVVSEQPHIRDEVSSPEQLPNIQC